MTTNTFPDSEVYLINWLGGTSGAFISAIVDQFINDSVDEIVFSRNGNVHDYTGDRNFNLKINPTWRIRDDSSDTHSYKKFVPEDSTKPSIMIDHNIPAYEDLFEVFPKCKIILITRSTQMSPRLSGNMFFKNTCDGFPVTKNYWEGIRLLHTSVAEFEDPNDVPIEIAEEFIKEISTPISSSNRNFFDEDYIHPEEYKDNIVQVSFYDIIHNSTNVLQQLSDATNKPITPEIELFYEKYLEAQDELVKTKMPWLDDK